MRVLKLPTYKEVLRFIEEFKRFDYSGEVTRTFVNGYCYWFALILNNRFPYSEIVYYSAGNHFACMIGNRIFDITGDITNKNLFFESWDEFKKLDPLETARITKYCIDKTGI